MLFGLGLFLGMVGSFVRTLAPETSPSVKTVAHAAPTANSQSAAARSRQATRSPAAAESALSEALAMIAVALDEPPSTSPPRARVAPAAVPAAVPATAPATAPEQPSLDALMADAIADVAPMDPLAAAPQQPSQQPPQPPPQTSPPPLPPRPLAGQWVFDPHLGWLWLPANSTTVVIVPMIEMFPAGPITVGREPRTFGRKTAASSSKPSFIQQSGSRIPPPNTQGAKRSTVLLPSADRR